MSRVANNVVPGHADTKVGSLKRWWDHTGRMGKGLQGEIQKFRSIVLQKSLVPRRNPVGSHSCRWAKLGNMCPFKNKEIVLLRTERERHFYPGMQEIISV